MICFGNNRLLMLSFLMVLSISLSSQSSSNSAKSDVNRDEQLKYANLDIWGCRIVKESGLIGGEMKKLYYIGRDPQNECDNPWSTTNIFAKIGVNVAAPCVFPEKTDDGYCCRMESRIVAVDVIGIRVKVLVSGTLFVGSVVEPVRSVGDPIRKLNHGVVFSGKPRALQFSYKYSAGKERRRVYYSDKKINGIDKGEFCLILQQRKEDADNNVFAKRIGGIRLFFNDTGNRWVRDTVVEIYYGDITNKPFYKPEIMGLIPDVSELYVKNSKSKMVSLKETAWGTKNDTPTHLVMYFTSSYEGINFTGSPNSVLWVDDIKFIY